MVKRRPWHSAVRQTEASEELQGNASEVSADYIAVEKNHILHFWACFHPDAGCWHKNWYDKLCREADLAEKIAFSPPFELV